MKTAAGDSREEIPESVTAELEKLEQEEGGPSLVEVEGVNAILGDLVEDDDELLGNFITLILTYILIWWVEKNLFNFTNIVSL